MNWMRPAAINQFRKLYGRIDRDISQGTYHITIENSKIVIFNLNFH